MWIWLIATFDIYNFNVIHIFSTPVSLTVLISYLVNLVTTIAAVVAFFVFIFSGFLYLTAGGDPDKAKKGQQGIVNAIIGILIIALSYVILTAVTSYLNIGNLS